MVDVLFVAPDLSRGGVGRCVSFIVDEVPRHGLSASLFVMRGFPLEYTVANRKVDRGMAVTGSSLRFYATLPLILIRLVLSIRRHQPEIVCSHGLLCNLAVVAARMFAKKPYRSVAFEHNSPAAHYAATRLSKIKTALLRFAYPRHDMVVGVSRGVADDLLNLVPSLRGKCRHIYNGLEIDEIRQQSLQAPSKQPPAAKYRVVSVGRLLPAKDYRTLISAAAILDDPDVTFVVIGEGPLESELLAFRDANPSRSKVVFLGHMDNPFPALASSDVFLLTSLRESFCIALVEALCLGIPVLSTDCPNGPAEILKDGQYGLLVSVGDAQAIADNLRRLLYQREPARQLRALGPLRANEFSSAQHGRTVVDLFRSLSSKPMHTRGV